MAATVRPRLTIPIAHGRLVYRRRPLVMGILNITPDSFSDAGLYVDPDSAVQRGLQMEAEGAGLLDVGGESTRPGSLPVSLDEELRRVVPVIRRLAATVAIPISIDTSKAEVARQAIDAGASIVNDVSALRADSRMAGVVAQSQATVILMHMRGTPRMMQQAPRYRDVVAEVIRFLKDSARRALAAGIRAERILVDPGLGFGKTLRHNLELLRELKRLCALGYPVVLGPSRKSFIGSTLHVDVQERLAGTLACVAHAHRCGVHIVRVHDVQPAVQLVRMLEAIDAAGPARREH